MAKQFADVSSRYGAPMGRRSFGTLENVTAKVRLFRVTLDSGGYDDGGAYWGHGQPIFCATDGADYQQFTRAKGPLNAIAQLEIPRAILARAPMRSFRMIDTISCGGDASRLTASGFDLYSKLCELGFKG